MLKGKKAGHGEENAALDPGISFSLFAPLLSKI